MNDDSRGETNAGLDVSKGRGSKVRYSRVSALVTVRIIMLVIMILVRVGSLLSIDECSTTPDSQSRERAHPCWRPT